MDARVVRRINRKSLLGFKLLLLAVYIYIYIYVCTIRTKVHSLNEVIPKLFQLPPTPHRMLTNQQISLSGARLLAHAFCSYCYKWGFSSDLFVLPDKWFKSCVFGGFSMVLINVCMCVCFVCIKYTCIKSSELSLCILQTFCSRFRL